MRGIANNNIKIHIESTIPTIWRIASFISFHEDDFFSDCGIWLNFILKHLIFRKIVIRAHVRC